MRYAIALVLIIAAAAVLARRAQAAAQPQAEWVDSDQIASDASWLDLVASEPPDQEADRLPSVVESAIVNVSPSTYIEPDVSESTKQRNLAAFLAMIKFAEGTDRRSDPYRVCYGYAHTIRDLSDHPAVTGEWRGEKLPDGMCRAAGYGPGCVSTAAGAYQINRPTWLPLKRRLGLADFGPSSQDAAAVELIRQRGALNDVYAGRLADAVEKVAKVWASLPGAGYDQPERKLASLVTAYQAAGGNFEA